MFKYSLSSLLIIIVILFSSCHKNSDFFTEYLTIDTFFKESDNKKYVVSFEAVEESEIDLGRVKLTIPKDGLATINGQVYTGKVKLSYKHLEKVGDFIKYGLPTATSTGLLNTYSVIFLEFSNEQELLYPNKSIDENVQVYIPNNGDTEDLQKYQLTDNGWIPLETAEEDIVKTTFETTTMGEINGYQISLDNFGWLSFSEELEADNNEFTLCVNLQENHDKVNSVVFGTLDTKRTAIKFEFDEELSLFCGRYRGVIKDQSTTIVSISNQGQAGSYAFGTNYAILNNNKEINATLTTYTFNELCSELEKL